MESKRKPGFPRLDHQEDESDHSLTHKSDRFNTWGQVQDRRTEASQEIMNGRRVAPLKGARRHESPPANPFASQFNPFANLGQDPNMASQSAPTSSIGGSTQNSAAVPPAGHNMSTSNGPASTNNTSIFQGLNTSSNSNKIFSSFNFGTSSTPSAPSFGNSATPAQFGASQPSGQQSNLPSSTAFGQQQNSSKPSPFAFGQESSTTPSIFTFGQKQSEAPSFTFGQPNSAQQTSSVNQHQPSQTSSFTFGQHQNTAQAPSAAVQPNGLVQNPFSFLSQEPPKSQGSTTGDDVPSKSNIFGFTPTSNTSLFNQGNDSSKSLFSTSNQTNSKSAADTAPAPNLFAPSQSSTNGSKNDNFFGTSNQTSLKQGTSLFSQPTSQGEPAQGNFFGHLAAKSNEPNGLTPSQDGNDTFMTASPTKATNHSNDSDTIMTSPTKVSSTNRATDTSPKPPETQQSSKANTETSQQPPLEIPKFGTPSFESGPFKNPFDFPSMSTGPSWGSSQAAAFKPPFSLDGDAFKVPAFVPPFSIGKDNDAPSPTKSKEVGVAQMPATAQTSHNRTADADDTSQSKVADKTVEKSHSNAPNDLGASSTDAQRDVHKSFSQQLDDETAISDSAMELKVFNRAFIRALDAMDPMQDHSDMMRAYLSQAAKIRNSGQHSKRKALEDFNGSVKRAKNHGTSDDLGFESPGKSKTSNLFASILGKANATAGASSDNTSPNEGPNSIHATGDTLGRSSPSRDASSHVHNEPHSSGSLFGLSESSATSVFGSSHSQPSRSVDLFANTAGRESQISNATDDAESVASNESAGKSLFERIDPGSKPSSPFQNPFTTGQAPATDQTWKADSPIKFGSSNPNPSFLMPSQAAASPGTSRATTPGTVDGGMTSEAESTTSNVGEANDSDAPNDSETTSQPQVDLTAEDFNQEILFETEKARGSIRDTTAKAWETRGVGPVRILKNSDTGSNTVLMRLSPSGKVLFHTTLLKGISYTAQGSGIILPVATEGNKLDSWYIRFKTKDLSEAFAAKCEELKNG